MRNFTVTQLVDRHRLSLAQVQRLGWGEIEKEDLVQEKVRALSELKQIQKVLDQIEKSGIFFICLKGFALSQRIYEDPTVRFSKDLDILVPDREDVILLGDFLFKQGWIPVEENWIDDQPRRYWYMNLTTHFSISHPHFGVVIEIHWDLDKLLFPINREEKVEFLKRNSEKMLALNREITVLQPDLEFVFLLAHGARHAWFRLKWLVDIHHYPFNLLNKDRIDFFLKKIKVESLPKLADDLLKHYFGKGLPFSFNQKANSHLFLESKKRIDEESWDTSLTLPQFLSSIKYNWALVNDKKEAMRSIFLPIFLRTQDLVEVKLDSYWKYFFYRYYSLIKRKVLKN